MTFTAQANLPLATGRDGRVDARIAPLLVDAAIVAHVIIGDRQPRGANNEAVAEESCAVVATALRGAVDAGVPIVMEIGAWGTDAAGGIAGTHTWGTIASALVDASGRVPIVALVDGPCLGPFALLMGLADVVIGTDRARFAVSSPRAAERLTNVPVDDSIFGHPTPHATEAGTIHLRATDRDDGLALAADLLDLLPANTSELPTRVASVDPVDRRCERAGATVPTDPRRAYDVRDVIGDVVDDGELLELHEAFAPSIVVGFARLDGHSVGIVANQPCVLAGAIDIASSQKAARFIRLCDSFNVPIISFVDTPGFRPGRDQEWQGMIRHGAQLTFAYAEATVPRCCVILRKAYGGAYIVMDSKSMGNDVCVAWPNAEIAVMGAAGAVEILHRRTLDAMDPAVRDELLTQLLADYEATFLTPRLAYERGYLDEVIDPGATRAVLCGALAAIGNRRERLVYRRHSNTPL